MENDFLKEVEHLGLTARLKRISDNMIYSAKDLYKTLDLDIDPNWHLVLLMFKKQETLTMTEIADAFQISQTAIIKIINKMKSKGYLEGHADPKDSRKSLLKLSNKAKKQLTEFEKVWEAGRKSIIDILGGNDAIFYSLSMMEKAIMDKSFKDRTINHLKDD